MSSGPKNNEYFEQYPKDFFDLVIIDECHRGGANDESSWRGVIEYFSSAVQIGLTATPKRKVNTNTYEYFGEPVFTYSLKDGIEDGFLTPFKVKAVQTDKDNYLYEEGDVIVQGEIDKEKKYQEKDFNLTIKMPAREIKRVELMLNNINPKQKTLVFCRDIEHAGDIRNIINKLSVNPPVNYCVRVTAEDGVIGETYLRQFQDNEKLLPTILTTSRKLSTGVDARNIRNIVLLRPVTDMVEFKQIIGRGTRLYKNKNYFTIIDFVKASELFLDPEWDGEPEEIENNINFKRKDKEEENEEKPKNKEQEDKKNVKKEKIIVQLAEGRELEIKSMITTMLLYDGVTVTPQEFIKKIFNVIKLPRFFSNEEELRKIWSSPITRKELLNKLEKNGLARQDLKNVQELIEAENSDLYDVLEYIAFSKKPISRKIRVNNAHDEIFRNLTENQKDFLNFVLNKYIQDGVDELELEKLSDLITLKYKALYDGEKALGEISSIKEMFINFQKHLYQ
jgi:type I restriction enzyme R subunit